MKNQAILTISILINLAFFISSFRYTTIADAVSVNKTTEISMTEVMAKINRLECQVIEQENKIFHLNSVISSYKNNTKVIATYKVEAVVATETENIIEKENTINIVEAVETTETVVETKVTEEKLFFGQYKATTTTNSYDASLVDAIDDIYFKTVSEAKGIDNDRKDELTDYIVQMEKDLEEFTSFADFVHPEAIKAKKEQARIANAKTFKGKDVDLNTTTYYNVEELNSRLGAKLIDETFNGFCINLIVSDEVLPANHPIFTSFGKLKMEKTEDGQFRYFMDGFKSQKSANQHLETIILPRYSEAEVTFYKNGKRKSAF
jgi:hypothetical protein